MRSGIVVALFVSACSNDQPPPITDPDGSFHEYIDSYVPPIPIESGVDGGSAYDLDFQGDCLSGYMPVWHFFDFQTHTPSTSSLQFSARTADTEALLDAAPEVSLATVTGPDITTWTGVDVAAALQGAGLTSRLFLRVIVVATPAGDGTLPVLVHYRQAFDCVVGQ
jgi:hypothetical protein